jgi:Ca-activated chloride channel homolog
VACAPARESVDGAAAYAAKDYRRAALLLGQAVQNGDQSPGALYNYGTALLGADSTRAAAEVLERAADKSGDDEVRYRARFNAGLAHLLQGRVPQADSASAELKATLALYKRVLLQRPNDLDAKWNYELALEEQKKTAGGGGGGGQSDAQPSPAQQQPKPQPTLAQRQAEQLLGSAEREERDVQSKKQKQNRPEPPPGGKDW